LTIIFNIILELYLRIELKYYIGFKIINAIRDNPELINIFKIANYFKCSMDEVVGRNNYVLSYQKTQVFFDVSPKAVSNNLRKFVKRKLEQQELNLCVLSKNIGYSEETLPQFMKNNSKKKALSSAVTVALADYFQVSLDEMVGRIASTKDTDKSFE
jgi:hypothetical protein